jgi:ABC-type multidrug transport system fused ATPase/permease subunit
MNNQVAVASALIIYNYSNRITSIVYYIGKLLDELQDFNLSTNRIKAIISDPKFEKEHFGCIHLDKVNGDFEFKNVTFSYDKKKVLDKINFKVNANETVAFVGKSGTGKTTIFNLLCKMYDIDSGEITIDGININNLDKESIRGNITIISQNPYIFNLSIKDNLKLVKNDINDKEIQEACKLACLDEFINSLPDKYDTIIGEGGVNLSGGQKQRLAIARALIQKTEIILFDEATSALDNETQSEIQNAINNLKGEYTILIVAHRLSTVIDSDKIFVVDNGKVVDSGTHKELLKKCDEYKKLYEKDLKV